MSDPHNSPEPPPPGYFPDPTQDFQPTVMDPAAIPYQPGATEATPAYRPGTPYTPPGYTPPGYTPPGYTPGAAQVPYQQAAPTYETTAQQPQNPYSAAPAYPQQPGYAPYQAPGGPGMPGAPAYSYPYQQPKKSRTGLIVGIIVAVVVLLVGVCVGGIVVVANPGDDKNTASPISNSGNDDGTSSPAVKPQDVPKDHTGDLRTFLIKPPSSSHPLSKPMSKTGTMTLEDDVAQSSDKTARRSFLEQYNFVIEAVVEWDQTDDTIVEVRLLRFDNTDDARGYFDEDKSEFVDDYGASSMTPVAGVLEAATFADTKKDKYGYVSTAGIGVKGDVVIVTFTSQVPPVSTKVSDTLMQKQYAKL